MNSAYSIVTEVFQKSSTKLGINPSRAWEVFLWIVCLAPPIGCLIAGFFICYHYYPRIEKEYVEKPVPGPVEVVTKYLSAKTVLGFTDYQYLGTLRIKDYKAQTALHQRAAVGKIGNYMDLKDGSYRVVAYWLIDDAGHGILEYSDGKRCVLIWEPGESKPPDKKPDLIKVKNRQIELAALP